jgi:hypothetical protein
MFLTPSKLTKFFNSGSLYCLPLDIYIGMDNDSDSNMIYLVPDENDYPNLNCTSDYVGFWD